MKKLFLTALFTAFLLNASAQQVSPEILSNAGNYYTSSANSISWTLGELVIETASTGSNTLTQGFHQNDYTIVGIENNDVNRPISVFPNPADDQIFVQMNTDENFQVYLYDMNGKLLHHSKHENGTANINMMTFAPASYLLKIHDSSNNFIGSYKIIKE